MIFQDPYASLNPRMRVIDIVGEAPVAHRLIGARQQRDYVGMMLESRRPRSDADAPLSAPVLGRPARAHRHRARARGEARVPRLRRIGRGARRVDPGAGAEPLHGSQDGAESDVSLHQPRSRRRAAPVRPRRRHVPRPRRRNRARPPKLFAAPNHPYTKALLAEVGRVEPKKRTFVPIKGEIPSPLDPPPGCHFHPRCPYVMPRCRERAPPLFAVGPGRTSACWLSDIRTQESEDRRQKSNQLQEPGGWAG